MFLLRFWSTYSWKNQFTGEPDEYDYGSTDTQSNAAYVIKYGVFTQSMSTPEQTDSYSHCRNLPRIDSWKIFDKIINWSIMPPTFCTIILTQLCHRHFVIKLIVWMSIDSNACILKRIYSQLFAFLCSQPIELPGALIIVVLLHHFVRCFAVV